MISFSVRVVHVVRCFSFHEADICFSRLVVGIVQLSVVVTRLTDGQDEAGLTLHLHPHVAAHLGFAPAALESTLLPREDAVRVVAPELFFTSTNVFGANDVAHVVLTSKYLRPCRHLVCHLRETHSRYIFLRQVYCLQRWFLSHCLVSAKRGKTRTRRTTHSTGNSNSAAPARG